MKTSEIRAFVDRDWSLVRDEKDRYWARRKHSLTPAEALAIAETFRRRVLALRPEWPDMRQREADLEIHRRVSESLRRVRAPTST